MAMLLHISMTVLAVGGCCVGGCVCVAEYRRPEPFPQNPVSAVVGRLYKSATGCPDKPQYWGGEGMSRWR